MTATSYSIGIDLGTTFTAAAVHRDGTAGIFTLGSRGAPIPSLVFLRDDQVVLTGEAAERRGITEPARLAREFKRRVGDSAPIMLGQAPYSAERLMAVVLKEVVAAVATREGSEPAHVAVSHPANWGPFKIDLLRHALDLAGLRSVTLLTEPVAAAVHYASKERLEPGSKIGVYDLGGGTFDAAVLQKTETAFVTLGEPEGIERLGGIDFDEAVMTYVRTELHGKLEELDGSDPSIRAAIGRLRRECVAAKEALSSDSETTIAVALPNVHTDIRLTRAEFEPMIQAAIAETIEALRRTIERAGVRAEDLDTILLVGGSSQIPLVPQMVSSAMGRPVAVDAHPKHSVALGAAIVAANAATAAPEKARPGPRAAEARVPAGAMVGSAGAGSAGTGSAGAGSARGATTAAATPATATPTTAAAATGAGTLEHASQPLGRTPHSPLPAEPTIQSDQVMVPAPVPGAPVAEPGGPGAPGGRARSGGGGRPGPRRARIALVAVIAVALVAAGAAYVFARGSEDSPDQASGATTSAPTTTAATGTTEAAPVCESASGRCARITDITLEGETYIATYAVEDFDPVIFQEGSQGTPDDHHVHFFFDTTPPEDAGTNSPTPGDWVVWDRAHGGGELRFDADTVADAGDAQKLCVLVADSSHGVEQGTGNCVDLPT